MKIQSGILILLLVVISGCGDDTAQIQNILATISGMNPASVSIGQPGIDGTISGSNFSGVSAVNLGDGISVEQFNVVNANQISVRFSVGNNASPGQRTISITNAAGTATSTNVLNVINNKAPKASFVVTPAAGSKATEFEFDGSPSTDSDGTVLQFRFDFGDGATANGRKVKHKYANLGTFDVRLTVTDNDQATNFATREIEVLNDAPPVAIFKIKPGEKGSTQTDFEFDGSESYDPEGKKIASYLWDFGDGERKRTDKLAFHKYKKEGKFTVSLAVTDNKGLTGSTVKEVAVEKVKETKCTGGRTGKNGNPDRIIKILEVGPGRNIIIQPQGDNATCGKIYYKCGDVRQGGITIPNEVWYGTICEMYDRHDGTFRIRLGGGNGPVVKTAPQIYLHAATCNQYYFNLYCH